jgi:predicted Zn-dependent peptidase
VTAQIARTATGITVVVDPMPAVESVCGTIWFDCGSRDETVAERGGAHALEHLVLRSGRSALRIAVTDAGGRLGGLTTPEYMCFHFRVPRLSWSSAFSALTGAIEQADSGGFAAERPVIEAEILDRDQDPRRRIHELGLADLLGQHPLGRDPLGSVDDMRALPPDRLDCFRQRALGAESCLVIMSGHLSPADAAAAVESGLRLDAVRRPPRTSHAPATAAVRYREHATGLDRAYVLISMLAPGQNDPRRDALSLVNQLFGASADSLAWQRIRDTLGLSYNVYSYRSAFSDLGVFSVYASCSPASVDRVIAEIRDVLAKGRDLIDDAAVSSAATALAGSLALGLEAPHLRANWLGRHLLARRQLPDYDDVVTRLRSVTRQAVSDLLDELTDEDRMTVTVIGGAS